MTGDQSAFARWLGVNKSNVSRAKAAGRLVLAADGLVDFEASAARWVGTRGGRADVAARHAARRGAAIPEPHRAADRPATARIAPAPAEIDAGRGGGRAAPQAVRLRYENDQIKIEMALRRGLRYDLAATGREAGGLGAMVRAGLERVIDQTAPRLAAAADALARRQIIEREVRRLRWMIRREMPRALRRMREAGKGAGAGVVATGGEA